MLTRREFVVAGGLALAGRLLPSSLRTAMEDGAAAEITMRASGGGARAWFDPVGLLVRPGTTVRWVLVDGVHTTTAYHPANGDLPRRLPEEARPWDSGFLTEPGETFEVTLELEGVYDFFCRPHEAAGMAGRIVVVSNEGIGTLAGDPGATPSWDGAAEDGVSPAALETLPAVEEVLREGAVRARGG